MRNHYAHRLTAYVDTITGEGVTDDGTPLAAGAYPSLPALLDALPCRVRTLYLCGPKPELDDSTALWFADSTLQGWTSGHADLGGELPMLSLTHVACPDGKAHGLDIRRMAVWFGDEADELSPRDACVAMARLEGDVQTAFDSGATLLGTPGMTGRDLWTRTTRGDYAPLDDGMQRLIRKSGQGRIEILTLPERTVIPAVYVYDGRWMYAALCRNLPVGPVTLDTVPEYIPYAPARYHVTFTVPAGWAHVGLLAVRDEASDRWVWPDKPGACYETWTDGVELDIALRNGWHVEIHERMVFQAGNPLERWVKKLQELRTQYSGGTTVDELCRAAVRNMVLHTIGGFHRAADAFPVVIYPDQAQRYNARDFVGDTRTLDNGVIVAKLRRPLSPRNAAYQHPEWSAHIYAKARARLLSFNQRQGHEIIGQQGMLHAPRADVLAVYTDSLYTACPLDWPDIGANGHFRLKETLQGPLDAPHTEQDMRRLRATMRGGH